MVAVTTANEVSQIAKTESSNSRSDDLTALRQIYSLLCMENFLLDTFLNYFKRNFFLCDVNFNFHEKLPRKLQFLHETNLSEFYEKFNYIGNYTFP